MPESHPNIRPASSRRRFSSTAVSTGSPALRRKTSTKFKSLRLARRQHHSTSSPSTDYTALADSSDHAEHLSQSSSRSSDTEIVDDKDGLETRLVPPLSQRASESNLESLANYRNAFRDGLMQEGRIPLAYASLPPTPITSDPPEHDRQPSPLAPTTAQTLFREEAQPFSLWDYLREELLATDFDSHQELKWERVSNFLAIPLALEKIISFGFILCFDSFLYTFTIQPIRFILAVWRLVMNIAFRTKSSLPPSQKADILRTLLLALSIMILIPLTDASKIYHSIRGQDTIKLYVIFNALEIADRLCASIGQDIIDCLFSRSTLLLLSHKTPLSKHTLRPILFFSLATCYIVLHALVMVYQMLCLNVAINSFDNALLSLLMSNQFVEIKGSVFKKFEKDSLFQITCADIVERFTLALMLFFVGFRNLIEMSGAAFDFSEGVFLPKSFGFFKGKGVLWTISYPVLTVMISEMFVDWLKHAFITKFNHIRPSVYERFTDVLCRDLSTGSAFGRLGRKHTYVDQSPVVARRLGFAALPLAVLTILIGGQSINLLIGYASTPSPGIATGLRTVNTVGTSVGTGVLSPWPEVSWMVWMETLRRNNTSLGEGVRELALRGVSGMWMSIGSVDWERVAIIAKWTIVGVAFWMTFVVIKIIMGVNLVAYASERRVGMEAREEEDKINDFGRDPIGEGLEERKYNRELKGLLDNARDDARLAADIGENDARPGRKEGGGGGGGEGKKKRLRLEDLTRYTMVKRIW